MKPLVTFFAFAYLLSWLTWFPLYGHIFGLNNLPTITFNHGLGGLGPMMAAVVTTWIYKKGAGVRQLFKKFVQFRPVLFLLIALTGPFVLLFIASLISVVVNGTEIRFAEMFTVKEFPEMNFFTFFIYNLVFFGFGEEAGWRGFALPAIQKKFNALQSSVVITFFWALWHWPLFCYRPGFTTMGVAGATGWIFSLLTGSILLTWLYNNSKGSILVCAVFHTTIDMVFAADISDKTIMNYLGFLITMWGIVTLIIFTPGNFISVRRFRNHKASGK